MAFRVEVVPPMGVDVVGRVVLRVQAAAGAQAVAGMGEVVEVEVGVDWWIAEEVVADGGIVEEDTVEDMVGDTLEDTVGDISEDTVGDTLETIVGDIVGDTVGEEGTAAVAVAADVEAGVGDAEVVVVVEVEVGVVVSTSRLGDMTIS